MSQFKKNGTMELETSIGYSFSLIKTEYKQNKIYQNKKKTKRTVNLSFQSALCQQSEMISEMISFLVCAFAFFKALQQRCGTQRNDDADTGLYHIADDSAQTDEP